GNDGGTATMAPATAEPELEAGTTVGTTLDDASLIIEPEIGAVNVPELCKSLWRLQGRVIETDLSGQVTLGPWSAVSNFLATSGTALDASVANDTAESDAGDRDSGRSDTGRSDAGRSDTGDRDA